jgi:hypothetical protein
MATLCACRPLDVGDQRYARHLVFLLLLILHCLADTIIIVTLAHGLVCISRRGSMLLVDASTVFNMHELAITSGFAAAYRLGADFPHLGDETCVRLFRLYLGLSHAARLVRSPHVYYRRTFSLYSRNTAFRGKGIGRSHKLSDGGNSFFLWASSVLPKSQL